MLDFRIGLLLGLRQLQRANPWATILIITVVFFTFLNLVAVSGILTGIIDGALKAVREEAIGDIAMNPLENESKILETERILRELGEYKEIKNFSQRYEGSATIEANYKDRQNLNSERDLININIQGVDPERENSTMNLSSLIVEGETLESDDFGKILIGKYYIDRYAKNYGEIFDSLEEVYPGDTVRVTVGDKSEEFIVKGIIDSKIDLVALSVFITEKEFRRLFNKSDRDASAIFIRLNPGYDEAVVREMLINAGMDKVAKVQSFKNSIPKFVRDTEKTFTMLSILIGTISITVASITVFIIVFINILSRKRQIGILKAIGIRRKAIQFAYATQAAFYALVGSAIGIFVVLCLLVPYFAENPIDFPYADVVLSAPLSGIFYRCLILFIIMVIAGIVPAWLIARQNTLNTILGRK